VSKVWHDSMEENARPGRLLCKGTTLQRKALGCCLVAGRRSKERKRRTYRGLKRIGGGMTSGAKPYCDWAKEICPGDRGRGDKSYGGVGNGRDNETTSLGGRAKLIWAGRGALSRNRARKRVMYWGKGASSRIGLLLRGTAGGGSKAGFRESRPKASRGLGQWCKKSGLNGERKEHSFWEAQSSGSILGNGILRNIDKKRRGGGETRTGRTPRLR